jgi:nucleoside-diphosphate-sugar epimerase
MKILITGNQGYVGPRLGRHLRAVMPDATLVGYDLGFFANNLTAPSGVSPEHPLDEQVIGDVRSVRPELFTGVDAVVQLAAVSNDPMGKRFAAVTDAINAQASIAVAKAARDAGVKRFVFASSCSVYGAAPGDARKETDDLNPQTAYAHSKVDTEKALEAMDLGGMTVTCLRFATACGMSDRLRLDLVLNDFVASAIATNRITVLSDGTPWRPLIDTGDMARAMEWACVRDPAEGGRFLSVNVGSLERNYQVRDLAHAVKDAIPGTEVSINTAAQPDTRSYKVDFSLFKDLAPKHQPQISLGQSIDGLKKGLTALGFGDANFRDSRLIRLKTLEGHIAAGRLDDALRWTSRTFGDA